jgi:hypothetical protein
MVYESFETKRDEEPYGSGRRGDYETTDGNLSTHEARRNSNSTFSWCKKLLCRKTTNVILGEADVIVE